MQLYQMELSEATYKCTGTSSGLQGALENYLLCSRKTEEEAGDVKARWHEEWTTTFLTGDIQFLN